MEQFSSSFFNVNVGVGQDSVFSPILSALYLVSFLHILDNCLKNLEIPVSILSFVDDSLLIAQNKFFHFSNSLLFCSYNIVANLLLKFGFLVKHSKTEVFHFTRSHSLFNPPSLNLSSIDSPILHSKEFWRYLDFIFDRKLLFCQHINFYSNKAISTIKYMKILSNLVRGLNPQQKCLLYRSCILPIALYGFQLWYYNRALLSYPLKILGKMQRRAAIWILGAFKMFSSFGIKAIASLISINLHLQKLSGRSQLQVHSLPSNHILHSLIEPNSYTLFKQHSLSLSSLIRHQCELIKGLVVDMDNHFNKVFPFFNSLNPKFAPEHRVIDIFSNCFSFHLFSKCNNNNLKAQIQQLDNLAIKSLSIPSHAIVITDNSIKNNITTFISHTHIHNKSVTKMLYHTVNVTSIEAELFAIKYGINQDTKSNDISKIIVITDLIHTVKRIIKIEDYRLSFSLFSFLILFYFRFIFLFLELWVRVRSDLSHCYISHI